MTPLDKLAQAVAAMSAGPWKEGHLYSALRYFRNCGPDFADHDWYTPDANFAAPGDDRAMVLLRNVADELIAVAEAAECTDAQYGKLCGECEVCAAKERLDARLKELMP